MVGTRIIIINTQSTSLSTGHSIPTIIVLPYCNKLYHYNYIQTHTVQYPLVAQMAAAHLSSFLDIVTQLHAHRKDDAATEHLVDRLVNTDELLQAAVGASFDARDRRERAERLADVAQKQQSELIEFARQMHSTQTRLDMLIDQSRDALAAADAAKASGRRVPTASLVELAARVSYSNAAPCSGVARDGAERQGWYHGWGAPAPQQHMLARAQFAMKPASVAVDAAAAADASAEELAGSASAPTFTQATAAAAAAESAPQQVSMLTFDSDEESDEFD